MFNALSKGFGTTFRQMFRPPVTTEYPDQKRDVQLRFHGRHVLNRHPDGLEKCVGCELCAWACPADAIYVVGADNTPEARWSPGERYGAIYQINYLRCIFCGLCLEACPTRALTMSHEYELSADSREAMIFTREQLLAPMPEGAKPPPHTDAEVAARGLSYYEGFAAQDPLAHYVREPPHPEDTRAVAKVKLVDGGREPPEHTPDEEGAFAGRRGPDQGEGGASGAAGGRGPDQGEG